jgi:hypothetical protein
LDFFLEKESENRGKYLKVYFIYENENGYKKSNIMSIKLNIYKKPEQLLLFAAITFLFALVISLIAKMDFQDIKLFSVPLTTILWIIPLLFFALWLLYIFANRFLYSVTFTRIHVFITVFVTILILIGFFVSINPSQELAENHETIGSSIHLLFLLFVFAQLLCIANLLLGLLKKEKQIKPIM